MFHSTLILIKIQVLNRTSIFTSTLSWPRFPFIFPLVMAVRFLVLMENCLHHIEMQCFHPVFPPKWRESFQEGPGLLFQLLTLPITSSLTLYLCSVGSSLKLKSLLLATDTVVPFDFYICGLLLQIWVTINKIKAMNFSPN